MQNPLTTSTFTSPINQLSAMLKIPLALAYATLTNHDGGFQVQQRMFGQIEANSRSRRITLAVQKTLEVIQSGRLSTGEYVTSPVPNVAPILSTGFQGAIGHHKHVVGVSGLSTDVADLLVAALGLYMMDFNTAEGGLQNANKAMRLHHIGRRCLSATYFAMQKHQGGAFFTEEGCQSIYRRIAKSSIYVAHYLHTDLTLRDNSVHLDVIVPGPTKIPALEFLYWLANVLNVAATDDEQPDGTLGSLWVPMNNNESLGIKVRAKDWKIAGA